MKLQNDMFRIVEMLPSAAGSTLGIRISFNAEHEIFKAHFPGNPIMPGVCIVKILTELLEGHLSRDLFLDEINNLKFVSTISPVDDSAIDIMFTKIDVSDDYCKAKGVITNGDKTYTKFSLTYGYNQI